MFEQDEILELHGLVKRIAVADDVIRYAMSIARRSRTKSGVAPAFVREWLSWGGGPRATQYLLLGAKACALMAGRTAVTPADVRRVAHPVLRHRVMLSYHAEAESIVADEVITELLDCTPAPDRQRVVV